jgi:hypothetical protein
MKTTTTIKQSLLALTIALSIVSCKKDKKDPEPTPPAEVKIINLTDLKALSTGASVKVPDGKKISGVVISDVSGGKNIDSKTVILQEASDKPGIIVAFDAAQTFALGDQVEVNISNQTLAQVNGEVVLTNIPAANAKKTGTGTITARTTTAAAIATNKAAWNGTLVQLPAGTFSGGNGKFSGTIAYTDASGAVKSAVLAGAAFENTDYSLSVDGITGIVRISGNDIRVDLRNASDVNSGVKYTIMEDFKNVTLNSPNDYVRSLTTPTGEYGAVNGFSNNYHTPLNGDDFLDQARKYLYITGHDDGSGGNGLNTGTINLKGLKTFSISVAGSKYTGKILPTWEDPNSPYYSVVSPFDAAKHKIGITIYASNNDYGIFPLTTIQSSEVGKLNTYTIKYPASVDEFIKLIVNTTDPNYAGISAADAKPMAESFMTTPGITIGNSSTNRNLNTPDVSRDFAPVVIDKVVFGFEKKPE